MSSAAASSFRASLVGLLPNGRALPDELWRRRHRATLTVLWLHVPLLLGFAVHQGYALGHALVEASLVAVLGVAAAWASPWRRPASALATFGLLTASAVLVHLSGGMIEAHFHYFVVLGIIILYQDWLPFGVAVAYVLLQHGVIGAIDGRGAFNHPAALAQPWRWAAIHSGFVLAAGAANIWASRLNEDAHRRAERYRQRLEAAELRERLQESREELQASEERFRALVQHASDVVLVTDAGGTVSYVSPAAERVLGRAVASLEGRPALALVHPDDVAEVTAWSAAARAREDVSEPVQFRVAAAGGGWRHVEAVANNLLAHPAVAGLVLTIRDVTERHRTDQELWARARQQAAVAELGQRGLSGTPLAALFDDAVALVAETLDVPLVTLLELLPGDQELVVVAAVGWPAGTAGATTLPATGRGAGSTFPVGAAPVVVDDLERDRRGAVDALLRARGARSGISVVVGDPAAPFGLLLAHSPRPRSFGDDDVNFLQAMANVLGTAIGRRQMEDEIRHQALHDALTGLPNRTLLHDRLTQAISLATRTGGEDVVGLLLLDLDRFKEVNDALGHDIGDLVLREVARRVRQAVRESDTLARLGGDEFAVLLPSMHSPGDAALVARKILDALDPTVTVGGDGIALHVEGSIGIALAPQDGATATALFKRADVAMYRAKDLPEGIAVYSAEHDEPDAGRLGFVAALRTGIEDGQLLLHYQPKVELSTGRVSGVEALVRWQHPHLGLLPPDRFIPLAEQTGLIHPLSLAVLRSALHQVAAWRDEGLDVPVSVNISARTLHDPRLLDSITESLDLLAVPAELLVLEITESAMMVNPPAAVEVINRLATMGVAFSIDDFGTGYSSLAYLRRLPVAEIKVDRSFVTGMVAAGVDVAIVQSVTELAHALDVPVVVEGVESAAVRDLLVDLGCDFAQGFFFGRPQPAIDLRDQLARSGRTGPAGSA